MQPNPSPNSTSTPAAPDVAGSGDPTTCSPGTIVMWGGTLATIPADWLHCDGTCVLQSAYPALWNAIGTNFGLNPPEGQFYLPDLRGRFVRGVDNGANRDPDVHSRMDMQVSTQPLSSVGSVQADAFQNHNHPCSIFPGVRGNIASGSYWANGPGNTDMVDASSFRASTETRPINAALFFIIKCR